MQEMKKNITDLEFGWPIQQKIIRIFILKVVIPVFPVFHCSILWEKIYTQFLVIMKTMFGSLLEAIYQENKEHTEPWAKRV
ncbi:hypothetical protein D925_01849 [Enterococcus faecalis B83616-1]|nr:hypothetical protein D925_01849 [Enterococcus faecalis B83616-1]